MGLGYIAGDIYIDVHEHVHAHGACATRGWITYWICALQAACACPLFFISLEVDEDKPIIHFCCCFFPTFYGEVFSILPNVIHNCHFEQ